MSTKVTMPAARVDSVVVQYRGGGGVPYQGGRSTVGAG